MASFRRTVCRVEADGPHVAFPRHAVPSAAAGRPCCWLFRTTAGECFGTRATVGQVVLVAESEAGVEMACPARVVPRRIELRQSQVRAGPEVRGIDPSFDGQRGREVAFRVVETAERRRASSEDVVRTSEHRPQSGVVHELAGGGLQPAVDRVREVGQGAHSRDLGAEDRREQAERSAPTQGRLAADREELSGPLDVAGLGGERCHRRLHDRCPRGIGPLPAGDRRRGREGVLELYGVIAPEDVSVGDVHERERARP